MVELDDKSKVLIDNMNRTELPNVTFVQQMITGAVAFNYHHHQLGTFVKVSAVLT